MGNFAPHPIVNSTLWTFPPKHPTREQTIELYTSKVANRPGKYRIYKVFNRDTKIAYAEFEVLPEGGAERMLKIVDKYLDKYRNKEDAISQNFSTWGLRGDTLDITWSVNSPYMRKLFKQRVLSYSAIIINNGKETTTKTFEKVAYTDTLNVTMKTEKTVYPVGTKEVTVSTPRDRTSTFDPQFIKKRETILAEGVADRIIGLYALGNSTREISDWMEENLGNRVSAETISSITDRVLPKNKSMAFP